MKNRSLFSPKPARPARARRGPGSNSNIPQISTNIRQRHRFRFVATGAVAYQSITVLDVAGICGVVGKVTNTSGALLVSTFKITHLEMWSPPASVGSSVSMSMSWGGFNNSPNIEYTDTSVSQAIPAHISCRPPVNSLASFWQTTGNSTALFIINCPVSTIIDITLEYLYVDSSAALTTVSLVTAVIGQMYYLTLDNSSSHVITPVGLFSTF